MRGADLYSTSHLYRRFSRLDYVSAVDVGRRGPLPTARHGPAAAVCHYHRSVHLVTDSPTSSPFRLHTASTLVGVFPFIPVPPCCIVRPLTSSFPQRRPSSRNFVSRIRLAPEPRRSRVGARLSLLPTFLPRRRGSGSLTDRAPLEVPGRPHSQYPCSRPHYPSRRRSLSPHSLAHLLYPTFASRRRLGTRPARNFAAGGARAHARPGQILLLHRSPPERSSRALKSTYHSLSQHSELRTCVSKGEKTRRPSLSARAYPGSRDQSRTTCS